MATAATSLLGLALPVTGELSGTWGDTVNTSITALLDSAVAGTTTLSVDADVTLTTTALAANQAREAIILWTAGGTVTRNITAPAQSKTYVVLNKTSSTQSIVIRGVGPTTGVTVLAGRQAMVAWDGTDYVEVSSGYVDGPASATDNAVARFDGTSGKTIQNSVVIIADTTGNMTGVGTLSSGAITSSSLTATRVLFAGTSGLIQDDADLTFNGTILTSTGFAGPLNGTVGATTANTGNFTTLGATGNVTLGDASTDTVQVNGYMGIGGAAVSSSGIRLTSTALTGTDQTGIISLPTITSGSTISGSGVGSRVSTAAAAFTVTNLYSFYAFDAIKGAGSTITNQHGVYIVDQTQGTNNYGITTQVSSGTNKFNIYASGTAANYFAGNVGVGVTPSAWGSSYKAFDANTYGALAAGTADVQVTGNAYFNGTNWIAKVTGAATRYVQTGGIYYFQNAPSVAAGAALTFSNAATLDASGNLGIGTTTPTNTLSVAGNANVTGNVTLGDATTDTVQVNGYMGVGGAAGANSTITTAGQSLTGTSQYGVAVTTIFNSASTVKSASVLALPITTASAWTSPLLAGFYAADATKGAGSTITNQHGLYIADQTQGTNNYGITSLVSSGTNKFNIYASGTAVNYFAGNVGIGTTLPLATMHASAPLSAGTIVNVGMFGQNSGSNPTVGQGARITLSSTNNAGRCAAIQGVHESGTNAHYMAFLTNANGLEPAERMRIDSAGNVGIGTTTPTNTLSVAGNANVTGNVTLGDAVADTITINSQFVTGTVLRAAQVATNTLALAAYDTDGVAYVNLITLTSSTTPTLALTSTGVGTINNMSIGATTASTGAFTTLSANSTVTFSGTTTNLALGTSQTTGTWIGGGTAQTGAITLGQSTVSQTINIGTGATTAVSTKAINIGTAGVSGATINIASGSATSGALVTHTWNAGVNNMRLNSAGNLGIGITLPAAKLQVSGDVILSNVDVINATYSGTSYSVISQDNTPCGVFFRPDGLRLFVMGNGTDRVLEYSLSTPWLVSSATYVAQLDVTALDTSPQDIYFRADGLKLYVIGQTNSSIYQYSLSTPWSITTASYDSISISVIAQDTAPKALWFKPNGLVMFVTGASNDSIYQYNLTTAWNVSTAVYLQSLAVTAQDSLPNGVTFTEDGSRMFMLGASDDEANVYQLTTPWNIATATFINRISLAAQDTNPLGFYIKPDGTKMYVAGSLNSSIYEYNVPSISIQLTGPTAIADATVSQNLTVYGASVLLGNVGIGTSTPSSKLNVIDSGTGANSVLVQSGQTGTTPRSNVILRVQSTATGRDASIQFSDNITNAAEIGMVGGPMYFATAGLERMRIDTSGNVGVGTISPTNNAGYKSVTISSTTGGWLEVTNGTVRGILQNGAGDVTLETRSAHPLIFGVNSTERARIDTSGNVGIGTSSPTVKLDVNGNLRISGNSQLQIFNGAGTSGVSIQTDNGSSSAMTFNTGGSERARIDSSGNVGVGTTSPTNNAGYKSVTISSTTGGWLEVTNGTVRGILQNGAGDVTLETRSAHPLIFGVNSTERARIDSSGNLLVGTTTATNSTNTFYRAGGYCLTTQVNTTAGPTYHIVFNNPNGAVGSISTNGTATTFSTGSDYRLKNTIQPMTGALARVLAVTPVTYKWNVDNTDGEGFIAHELAEVFPNAVVGEKDAFNADGTPHYQSIDTSFLVATLTAAIQEQQALIVSLTQRLTALESK